MSQNLVPVGSLPKTNRMDDVIKDVISGLVQKAQPADLVDTEKLVANQNMRVEVIRPIVAALIFEKHNRINRQLTASRVYDYQDAMKRGEWKVHHQGIAFYSDHTLADGQHRMAALALAGLELPFSIYPNFTKDAIDAIDRTTRRTAGEALQMMGYEDAKVKAAVAKGAMEYASELESGKKPRFTDPQIERFVIDNDHRLSEAVRIGRESLKNVSDACLGEGEAALLSQLMIMGGYPVFHVVGFISSIQQGVATYPESPTVDLSRQFVKAKFSDNNKDRLNKREKMALALKGAALWTEGKSVARVKWNPVKETLPTNRPPIELKQAA